jgi:hypothetical protein
VRCVAKNALASYNIVAVEVRLWHPSDAAITKREGRIIGLERTRLQSARIAALDPKQTPAQLQRWPYRLSSFLRSRPAAAVIRRWNSQ